MIPAPTRLLVLACSRSKRADAGLLPAIERYDGPLFRLLRRFQRVAAQGALAGKSALVPDLYIISAQFGFITASALLPDYDLLMTAARARDLQPRVRPAFDMMLTATPYDDVCVCLGKWYWLALGHDLHDLHDRDEVRDGADSTAGQQQHWLLPKGSIGARLSTVHRWLYAPFETPRSARGVAGFAPAPTWIPSQRQPMPRVATIKGQTIVLSPAEALARLRERLPDPLPTAATHCAGWCVHLDRQQLAPKWVVSQLVDLPVQAFHTADALRALTALGLTVEPVQSAHPVQARGGMR